MSLSMKRSSTSGSTVTWREPRNTPRVTQLTIPYESSFVCSSHGALPVVTARFWRPSGYVFVEAITYPSGVVSSGVTDGSELVARYVYVFARLTVTDGFRYENTCLPASVSVACTV